MSFVGYDLDNGYDLDEFIDQKVDDLLLTVQKLDEAQTVEFFGKVIHTLKGRGLLDSTLQKLNSSDWMALYKAVMNVGAGW